MNAGSGSGWAPTWFSLDQRHVMVTGAGSGLGAAIAEGVVAAGATLTAVDIDEGGLIDLVGQSGGDVGTVVCDVSNPDMVSAVVERSASERGPITGLVNCAGIARRGPAVDLSDLDWRAVLDVDLDGVFYFCREVGRSMCERAGGSIVNISSVAAQVGLTTGNANYAAAKGGVDALTRTLAVEWAAHGVRVNAVAPTHFLTPLVESALAAPGVREYFVGNIPLGRLGRPEDLVGPVVFLLSNAASMVTGHVLNVDGGHTVS